MSFLRANKDKMLSGYTRKIKSMKQEYNTTKKRVLRMDCLASLILRAPIAWPTKTEAV